jgi:predicted DNA-binding protein (UPF0251 family)
MAEIGRPKKVRYIQNMPRVIQFSPRGRPGRPEDVQLTMDEFEAVKLADLQGFSQSEGAMAMRISRPSFGRILRAGRRKIADALVNGKIIRIVMGDAQLGVRKNDLSKGNFDDAIRGFEQKHRRILSDLAGQDTETAADGRGGQADGGPTDQAFSVDFVQDQE